ncbi:MAG: FHA domain-containing protein [Aureliella sp.]
MAVIQVFDDGRDSYESFRIRTDLTSIGRFNCDICIPHDDQIAPKHIVIRRARTEAGYHWSIQDISGDLGLFVRARRVRLRDRSEFLVGSHRMLFQGPPTASHEAREALAKRLERGSVPGASTNCDNIVCASLSVCSLPRESPKLWLLGNEYWVGRAADCALRIADDEFLAPKHVHLVRQANGDWQAQTEKAPNGLWIRVSAIKVKNTCTFQIGEQRCRMIVC